MAQSVPFAKAVGDTVPKVDNAVAVGEDLEFQRRWWTFERIIWPVFAVLIVLDLLGLFGRGYLAKAELRAPSGMMHVDYERVERASTPSIMTFRFGPAAVRNGRIDLFVSQSVVKTLGAQRISPQPLTSTLGGGGITYSFPAADVNGLVEIALEPSFPGVQHFAVGLAGEEPSRARVIVVP